ncbi:MAG: hypothetical protein V4574_00610 [Pseudomonadota bacterium]
MTTRASDPGTRLYQYRPGLGLAMWVTCPRCAGPARDTGRRVVCIRCGYTHGEKADHPPRHSKLRLERTNPECRFCKARIPRYGKPARRRAEGTSQMAEVRCPMCGKLGLYPAFLPTPPLARTARTGWPMSLPPYLTRSIGRHTLSVHNLEHLTDLEAWLGATLRERGPVAGLTMMARLPRWMKAASAREPVVRALAEMRAQGEREGLW